jgi:hypothetical protein
MCQVRVLSKKDGIDAWVAYTAADRVYATLWTVNTAQSASNSNIGTPCGLRANAVRYYLDLLAWIGKCVLSIKVTSMAIVQYMKIK